MRSIKWWLTLELYAGAIAADLTGHVNVALLLAIAATVALLAALELGATADEDDAHDLTIERLALVLVYAWQHMNGCGRPAHPSYVDHCRRAAIRVHEAGIS